MCFFNNDGHPKGRLWMMKGHRIFEPGGIKKTFSKITQIKNQGNK
jgi:hypothetical protein